GGTIRTVGSVGDEEIPVDYYAVALQQELRALTAQTGQPLGLSQANQISRLIYGASVSERVMQRLLAVAALDGEARRLGLSVGDAQVLRQVVASQGFIGPDGRFDRDTYRLVLQNAGLSEREYEANVRSETTRTLLQGAVVGGIAPSATVTNTLLDFIAERRNITWVRLDQRNLDSPLPTPSETELTTYYQANSADFTLPESKRITYIWLPPELLLDSIEVDDDALRAVYEERIDDYVRPERRLVEQLSFGRTADAGAARARLDDATLSFDALVAELGMAPADIDLGDVTRDDLGAAADAVFAMTEPGVIGPLETSYGPSLFRMNGILNGTEVTFEQARPALAEEYSLERARLVIAGIAGSVDDLLAGGASLEEVADETEMRLARIDWWDGLGDQIAGYNSFRDLARVISLDDFPEIGDLEDGGIYAARLDHVIAPTLQPLGDVRTKVINGWENEQTEARLLAQAEALVPQFSVGVSLSTGGLLQTVETDITRDDFIDGAPESFVADIFDMSRGEVRVVEGLGTVLIVRLDDIRPPDTAAPQITALKAQLDEQITQSVAQDIFIAYALALQNQAGLKLNQVALNAVHAQFP
ncbi:MAG: peptidyl-prolyl cis-trans isomerase, partial [Halocynthiibacter sp.]